MITVQAMVDLDDPVGSKVDMSVNGITVDIANEMAFMLSEMVDKFHEIATMKDGKTELEAKCDLVDFIAEGCKEVWGVMEKEEQNNE